MRIQHNIMAMNAYRNYNTNTKALSGNLEKLSSGYKINRAGDDAAGLAISEKMRAQITGLDAAQKNVKDGISLVKTAEGAMQEIQDMLNRMDYLATQSANGTYQDDVDRENLQKEVTALKNEINRIADSANFNGINLLDGSKDAGTGAANFEGTDATLTIVKDGEKGAEGAKGEYTINFEQVKFTTDSTAKDATAQITIGGNNYTVTVSTAGATNKATIDGAAIVTQLVAAINTDDASKTMGGVKFTASDAGGGKLKIKMDEVPTADFTQDMSVTVAATNTTGETQGEQISVTPDVRAQKAGNREYAQAKMTLADGDITDGAAIKIGDTVYTFAVGKDSENKDAANVIDLTDMEEGDTGIAKAAADGLAVAAKNNKQFIVGSDNTGKVTFTEREGGVDWSKNDLMGTANGTTDNDGDWTGLIQMGAVVAAATGSGTALTLQIGDTSDSFNQLKVGIGDMHTKAMKDKNGVALDSIDIGTQTGAAAAIQTIKDSINYVSSVRGDLGAIQNRLEHTGNNLSVMAENIQDAESTIRDTDVANEMMSYVKNNILVQSAQAMLAQANQVPQGVLQLLG